MKNFKRVPVKKGASKKIILSLTFKDLEYWDEKKNSYIVYPGDYEVMIGSSSEDTPLETIISIK